MVALLGKLKIKFDAFALKRSFNYRPIFMPPTTSSLGVDDYFPAIVFQVRAFIVQTKIAFSTVLRFVCKQKHAMLKRIRALLLLANSLFCSVLARVGLGLGNSLHLNPLFACNGLRIAFTINSYTNNCSYVRCLSVFFISLQYKYVIVIN